MRVLVTGGAGFIGSHIAEECLRRGYEVRILDNVATGSRENLRHLLGHVEVFDGDIRDYDLVLRACQGVDSVFHQAALPSVPRSILDPITSMSVNSIGTTTVLKGAVEAGVRRVVYAASSSAYGNAEEAIKSETLTPKPLSPYAVSKLTGEYLLKAFANCYGLQTVGLRYFNVFGERQDPHSQYSGVIARFCKEMLQGQRPTINGDGLTSRDFTYVANAVAANLLAATAPDYVSGQIMNIACGDSITLLQLVAELNRLLGTDLQPIFAPERTGDVKHSRADIGKASALLGYKPQVDFATGLSRTLNWYRNAVALV